METKQGRQGHVEDGVGEDDGGRDEGSHEDVQYPLVLPMGRMDRHPRVCDTRSGSELTNYNVLLFNLP